VTPASLHNNCTPAAAAAATPAATLLRRLRWSALGAPFDWTRRMYGPASSGRALPPVVAAAAASLAAHVGGCASFRGDAALVNFYGTGDTLGGHVDDVEAAQDKPIVAFSLGCAAVFLLGGPSREQPPTALLLRGGDAVVMAAHARRCVHGVPRVLTPADDAPPARATAAAAEALAAAAGGGEAAAVAAWMQHTRINISVRDIS
jgi:alkylated DNA repair protein alkB family protein 1